jgi:Flp pilus assembly protein TadG
MAPDGNEWGEGVSGENRLYETWQECRGERAAALAEFAIALPLLVVLVVGIFDFGAAFNAKQELNNALREGARFGSTQPTNDLGNGSGPACGSAATPCSVQAIMLVVDAYMVNARINDCGLASATGSSGGIGSWTYNASTGCPSTLNLRICRSGVSCAQSAPISGGTITVLTTQLQISYPYQWHFNNVLQLLIPGASLGLTNIKTQATAVNMD